MSQNCQYFCGCQRYLQQQPINTKVYVCFTIILIVIMIAIRTGTQWFIYKDYYPLKQKSPLLCIVMIAFISMQILLYPVLYIYNYFTQSYSGSQEIYRMFYYGLDGTIYFIYVLRSLRLVYSHTTDPSRQRTYIFTFFKYQYMLGSLAIFLMILRMVPIYFNPDQGSYPFFTIIQFSTPFMNEEQVPFLVKTLTVQFLWVLVLIYCLKIQSLTHPKHSMKSELILIISVNLLLNIVNIILVSNEIGQISLFFGICRSLQIYPSVEITKSVSLMVMFSYTALYPLINKKVYHMLLPTGRNYGLMKTMRDFLLEPEFMDIFEKFLRHIDQQEGTTKNIDLLEKWKKVMILKFSENKTQQERLYEIKKLLEQNQQALSQLLSSDSPPSRKNRNSLTNNKQKSHNSHNSLVKSLLKSIQNLEQPLNLSQQILHRYRQDINQKVQTLQRKLLQKLDKIYKQKYHCTKSYYHLKTKLNFYKKVNVNMILMKMALMVESDEIV